MNGRGDHFYCAELISGGSTVKIETRRCHGAAEGRRRRGQLTLLFQRRCATLRLLRRARTRGTYRTTKGGTFQPDGATLCITRSLHSSHRPGRNDSKVSSGSQQ